MSVTWLLLLLCLLALCESVVGVDAPFQKRFEEQMVDHPVKGVNGHDGEYYPRYTGGAVASSSLRDRLRAAGDVDIPDPPDTAADSDDQSKQSLFDNTVDDLMDSILQRLNVDDDESDSADKADSPLPTPSDRPSKLFEDLLGESSNTAAVPPDPVIDYRRNAASDQRQSRQDPPQQPQQHSTDPQPNRADSPESSVESDKKDSESPTLPDTDDDAREQEQSADEASVDSAAHSRSEHSEREPRRWQEERHRQRQPQQRQSEEEEHQQKSDISAESETTESEQTDNSAAFVSDDPSLQQQPTDQQTTDDHHSEPLRTEPITTDSHNSTDSHSISDVAESTTVRGQSEDQHTDDTEDSSNSSEEGTESVSDAGNTDHSAVKDEETVAEQPSLSTPPESVQPESEEKIHTDSMDDDNNDDDSMVPPNDFVDEPTQPIKRETDPESEHQQYSEPDIPDPPLADSQTLHMEPAESMQSVTAVSEEEPPVKHSAVSGGIPPPIESTQLPQPFPDELDDDSEDSSDSDESLESDDPMPEDELPDVSAQNTPVPSDEPEQYPVEIEEAPRFADESEQQRHWEDDPHNEPDYQHQQYDEEDEPLDSLETESDSREGPDHYEADAGLDSEQSGYDSQSGDQEYTAEENDDWADEDDDDEEDEPMEKEEEVLPVPPVVKERPKPIEWTPHSGRSLSSEEFRFRVALLLLLGLIDIVICLWFTPQSVIGAVIWFAFWGCASAFLFANEKSKLGTICMLHSVLVLNSQG